jgi:acetyltransferase-like isoleucine patch superfamily enzyme
LIFIQGEVLEMYVSKGKDTHFDIGERVIFGDNVVFGPNCQKIAIGYGSFLGNDIYIDVPELKIGEYTTVHNHSTIHGYKPCKIGHNCWFGQNTIIDSIAGTNIGNNVGIGAFSQLWTHIKFGDTLAGCRWNKTKPLLVEDDVWFVGHCIVSPIHAKKGSMLLVGGVIAKDMEENRVYGGVPAKDLTEALGPQFKEVSQDQKEKMFISLYKDFLKQSNLTPSHFRAEIVEDLQGVSSDEVTTYFCVKNRTYNPSRTENEFTFMKFILYEKAKFIPV